MTAAMRSEPLVRGAKRALKSICPRPLLNWREAQYYGKYGEIELHLVAYLCRRHQDAIDVGAHDGCYIHFMKRFARRVHAFEPIPWMADDLARKFRQGVEVHKIALSSAAGATVLRLPFLDGVMVPGCASISEEVSANYPEHREVAVRMETLDDVYSGDVGFIKIDVEGHERAVLDGARKTLARCQPRLIVEVDERLSPDGVVRMAKWFRALDYQGFFVCHRELMPIERFDASTMQRREEMPDLKAALDTRERFGHYINNFIFLPANEPYVTIQRIEERLVEL